MKRRRHWLVPGLALALSCVTHAQAQPASREGDVAVDKDVSIHYVEAGDDQPARFGELLARFIKRLQG